MNSVSVVLPTYTEKETLARCIDNFLETGVVKEIIVVDNNAKFDVDKIVGKRKSRKVKIFRETTQGYGAALKRGLREAKGNLIAICEPDGTFIEKDIFKLLNYSDEFGMVVGSRTMQELIWKGANMGFALKWGNYFVAKLMQVLFNVSSLSDVGCTFRVIDRKSLKKIEPYFVKNGGDFGLEMMILCMIVGVRMIQIPVNYKDRKIGESTYSGNLFKAAKLGVVMIFDIISMRFINVKK